MGYAVNLSYMANLDEIKQCNPAFFSELVMQLHKTKDIQMMEDARGQVVRFYNEDTTADYIVNPETLELEFDITTFIRIGRMA